MNVQRALEVFGLENVSGLDLKGLKTMFKKLAMERHPDQGGSNKDFVLLKEAHLVLEEKISTDKQDGHSNNLKILSKEEILNKYYRDTHQLQVIIEDLKITFDDQAEVLDNVKQGTEAILSQFDEQKEKLKQELESSISKLEKSYHKSFLQKILFFLPSLSEKEFWEEYRKQVGDYSKKNSDLDAELYKVMLSIYGEGLNTIAKLVGKVE